MFEILSNKVDDLLDSLIFIDYVIIFIILISIQFIFIIINIYFYVLFLGPSNSTSMSS